MRFNKLIEKLLKEANFGRKEFYHGADKSHMQSFVAGIKPEMAGVNHSGAGKEQGAGFYVFKHKVSALNYFKSQGSFIKEPIVVVIDQDLNTDCFDIDYEAEADTARDFLVRNYDYLQSHPVFKNIIRPPHRLLPNADTITVKEPYDNSLTGIKKQGELDTSVRLANLLSDIFRFIKENEPETFNKFEDEVMNKVNVLKYNGTQTIFPSRIEDIQGNVLWQT